MRKSNCSLAIILLMLSGISWAQPIPSYPSGVKARAAQINAKLSVSERAWLKQEAAREAKANIVSEAIATQAVRSAGSALDLSKLPIEDAVMMIFMLISEDARKDMREALTEMDQARAKKKDQRNSAKKQAGSNVAIKNIPPPILEKSAPHSSGLDDVSEQQQLKMQMIMDRMAKADSAASNALKKFSATSSGVIENMK